MKSYHLQRSFHYYHHYTTTRFSQRVSMRIGSLHGYKSILETSLRRWRLMAVIRNEQRRKEQAGTTTHHHSTLCRAMRHWRTTTTCHSLEDHHLITHLQNLHHRRHLMRIISSWHEVVTDLLVFKEKRRRYHHYLLGRAVKWWRWWLIRRGQYHAVVALHRHYTLRHHMERMLDLYHHEKQCCDMRQRADKKTKALLFSWWAAVVAYDRRYRRRVLRMALRRWKDGIDEAKMHKEERRYGAWWYRQAVVRRGLWVWVRWVRRRKDERARQDDLFLDAEQWRVFLWWRKMSHVVGNLKEKKSTLAEVERWRRVRLLRGGLGVMKGYKEDRMMWMDRLGSVEREYKRTVVAHRMTRYLRRWREWNGYYHHCLEAARAVRVVTMRQRLRIYMEQWCVALDYEREERDLEAKAATHHHQYSTMSTISILIANAIGKKYWRERLFFVMRHYQRVFVRRWVRRTGKRQVMKSRVRIGIDLAHTAREAQVLSRVSHNGRGVLLPLIVATVIAMSTAITLLLNLFTIHQSKIDSWPSLWCCPQGFKLLHQYKCDGKVVRQQLQMAILFQKHQVLRR